MSRTQSGVRSTYKFDPLNALVSKDLSMQMLVPLGFTEASSWYTVFMTLVFYILLKQAKESV